MGFICYVWGFVGAGRGGHVDGIGYLVNIASPLLRSGHCRDAALNWPSCKTGAQGDGGGDAVGRRLVLPDAQLERDGCDAGLRKREEAGSTRHQQWESKVG